MEDLISCGTEQTCPCIKFRIRGSNLPYITADVRRLARQRDFLRKKANKTGSKYLRQAFQQIKHRVTYTLRKLRSDYYTSKIAEHEGNPKATWRILKQVISRDTKSGDIERICHNGELVDNKALISETFNRHFVSTEKSFPGRFLHKLMIRRFTCRKTKSVIQTSNLKKCSPVKCTDS